MTNMSKMKRLLSVGLATVMSLGFATGAFASTQQQNDVDITIKSGEFSLALSTIQSFGDIELKSTPQTYKTSFDNKFTVKDLRGTQAGWRVDVSASPFSNGENTLPTGTLSLEPVSTIERVGTGQGSLPKNVMDSNKVIDDGTVSVLQATSGSGMGVFEFAFPSDALSVIIDPTTAKATENGSAYVSTLAWDLVQAP